MSHPLAVICPRIGIQSETFIRRHVQDLCPGRTAVVEAFRALDQQDWTAPGPLLRLGERSVLRRVVRQIHRRSGERTDAARIVAFLRRHGVQVVLGEYLDVSAPWIRPLRAAGLRVFVHAHGYDVSASLRDESLRRLYREALPHAHGIITMSRASRQRLLEIGLSPEMVRVVPYGTDVPSHPPDRAARPEIRCIAVGRMVAKKAPLVLLEAFRLALNEVPQLRLDVIGEGELLPAAEQSVRQNGMVHAVTLHGGQNNQRVLELMGQADIFLQHSMTDPRTGDEEGLPVAILEAMAHGLPVVSTRHAGIAEAVDEGQTGYLGSEGNAASMGERLIQLARDGDLRLRLGTAGWARCREQFSWQRERSELLMMLGLGV
jgi:glycosyltransferase involved in cell wall biosynthesis